MKSWRRRVADWSEWAAWLRVRLHFPLALGYLWLAEPAPRSLLAGGVLMLAGLLVRGWAAGHLRKHEGVTVTGPYARVRHPLYLGTAFLLAGLAVAADSILLAFPIPIYFAAFFIPTLLREERFQLAGKPDFYALYRALVPALVPRLRPVRFQQKVVDGARRFEFSRYHHNREWQAAVAAVALLLLLYGKIVFDL